MLASTVQFSRYGRPRSKTLPHPRQGATAREKTRPKPVPSGPNSVPDQPPASDHRSSLRKEAVLADFAGELTQ
jgi:hypothetical protein